jgi:hypothetical protein
MDIPDSELSTRPRKTQGWHKNHQEWCHELRATAIWRHGSRCWYCGVGLANSEVTLDHVIPRCKKGKTVSSNLVPACRTCNHEKKDLALDEYRIFVYGETRFGRIAEGIRRTATEFSTGDSNTAVAALFGFIAHCLRRGLLHCHSPAQFAGERVIPLAKGRLEPS